MKMTPSQAILDSCQDDASDYMKYIDKAISLLQEDPQVNYDVLLQEQLKEFYLLQPDQATLSDNFYFIEKQDQTYQQQQQEDVPLPYQPLRVRPEPQTQNPFRVRSKSPDLEILPGKENRE